MNEWLSTPAVNRLRDHLPHFYPHTATSLCVYTVHISTKSTLMSPHHRSDFQSLVKMEILWEKDNKSSINCITVIIVVFQYIVLIRQIELKTLWYKNSLVITDNKFVCCPDSCLQVYWPTSSAVTFFRTREQFFITLSLSDLALACSPIWLVLISTTDDVTLEFTKSHSILS